MLICICSRQGLKPGVLECRTGRFQRRGEMPRGNKVLNSILSSGVGWRLWLIIGFSFIALALYALQPSFSSLSLIKVFPGRHVSLKFPAIRQLSLLGHSLIPPAAA